MKLTFLVTLILSVLGAKPLFGYSVDKPTARSGIYINLSNETSGTFSEVSQRESNDLLLLIDYVVFGSKEMRGFTAFPFSADKTGRFYRIRYLDGHCDSQPAIANPAEHKAFIDNLPQMEKDGVLLRDRFDFSASSREFLDSDRCYIVAPVTSFEDNGHADGQPIWTFTLSSESTDRIDPKIFVQLQ